MVEVPEELDQLLHKYNDLVKDGAPTTPEGQARLGEILEGLAKFNKTHPQLIAVVMQTNLAAEVARMQHGQNATDSPLYKKAAGYRE